MRQQGNPSVRHSSIRVASDHSTTSTPFSEKMIQQLIRVVVGRPQCGEIFHIVDRRNALCFRKLGERQRRPE